MRKQQMPIRVQWWRDQIRATKPMIIMTVAAFLATFAVVTTIIIMRQTTDCVLVGVSPFV